MLFQAKRWRRHSGSFVLAAVLSGVLMSSCMTFRESKCAESQALIAYGGNASNGSQQILLATPAGRVVKQLTHEGNANFFPAWSPDGQRIAFTSDRGSTVQVWGMDAASGSLIQIPAEAKDSYRIAFAIGTSQIWMMDADGSNQTQLTSERANAHPAWSPNGKTIAFSSHRTGKMEIWVMNADGSDQRQLAMTPPVSVSTHVAQLVATGSRFHGLGWRNSDYTAEGDLRESAPPGQLYNIREDPCQSTDVCSDHPEIVARLTALLHEMEGGVNLTDRAVNRAEMFRGLLERSQRTRKLP